MFCGKRLLVPTILLFILIATGSQAATWSVPGDFATIQAAIDGAAAGDVINVAAGHFEEQLHITKDNLTIDGAGAGATYVDSPATLPLFYTTSADNYPVVFIENCEGVTLSNLTVDGLGRGDANYRFQGVGFYNAGGSLDTVDVDNIMDTPFSGAQHGNGVYAYADDVLPHAIALDTVNVHGFQKTGVVIAGEMVSATLIEVNAYGQGSTSVTAQNGIQASYGASVSATDCEVHDVDYIPADWAASGYLGYEAASFDMSGCTATGCMISLYIQDTSGSFNNGSVTSPISDGLYVYETGAPLPAGPGVKSIPPAQAVLEEALGLQDRGTVSFSVDNSTFTGTDLVDSWGVTAYGYGTIDFTVSNCLVEHWDWGVVAYDFGGATINATVNNNRLIDNTTYGVYSNLAGVQDAERNWWGDTDPSDQVGESGLVDYSPWYNDIPGTSPMPLGVSDTIQDAIDLATPGATISVAAGSYTEQLNAGKLLYIEGAGEATTTVLSPAALTDFFSTGADNYPVVYIHDADVHLSDLTVDGDGQGNANYRFIGVGFWNAGGSLTDVTVTGVRETPFSGSQHGVGVYSYNDTGGPYAIACTDVTVDDYQKNAFALAGAGMTVDLLRVSCTGVGLTPVIAQNGIQIAYGAGGTVTDCEVANHHWDGTDWTSSGVLLYAGELVTIENLSSTGDQTSISIEDHDADINGSTLDHAAVDPAFDGIGVFSFTPGPAPARRGAASPLHEDFTPVDDRGTVNVSVTNTTITGHDLAGTWGLDGYAADGQIDLFVDGCTVTGFETGAWMEEDGGILLADLTDNEIFANGDGAWSNTATPVDARECWWGDPTGPYHPTLNVLGLGNAVSDNVLFDPWTGLADLSLTPASSGPINCSQSSVLTVRYERDDFTPPLRGYEITLDSSDELDIGAITDLGALNGLGTSQYFDVVDNLDGTFTVSAAILGATAGLLADADLFTVEVAGAQTGTGTVDLVDYKLRDPDNVDFFATLAGATVDVDCTPPDVPLLSAEPGFTQGLENALDWSDMSGSGATEYLIERAEDAAFTLGLADSGWLPGLTHTFTGLVDGQIYYYRVMTRDALLNESGWSNVESSTQDDTAPDTFADALSTYQGATTWDVAFTESDATSGTASVDLYYQYEGGGWSLYASSASSPIGFTATDGDGLYGFYTVGTDNVGNAEDAPAAADATTTLDVTPPAGTFVINGDAAFTNTLTVNLNSAVTDIHPPLEMRFSNDGISFDPWVAYATSYPWGLPAGPDGTRTVWAEYRDYVGNVLALQDDIDYDATAPGGIGDLALSGTHEEITVTWTDPGDADLATIEVYRGVWHDGANVSAYPEYDDLANDTMPTRPVDRADAVASPEWVLAGTALPGDGAFVDAWAPRGVYVYQLFTVDTAANFGPAQAGPPYLPTDGVFNYWLGDVYDSGTGDGSYDGFVNIGDITVMGATFGLCDGMSGYNNEVDVGPTSDDSPLGIPLTDSCIDFEDLIIIAINYGMVAPLVDEPTGTGDPVFSWYRVDENTWVFGLLEAGAGLQGVRITAALPEGVLPQVTAARALQEQGPYFLGNVDRNGLDAGVALLGTGRAFRESGELFRVTLPAGVEPGEITVTARNTENAEIQFALDDAVIPELPAAYRIAQNFPNPFNPKTEIRFDLPDAQFTQVAVYGADGRLIRQLVDAPLAAGFHRVVWDGRDTAGEQVASGMYFYRIQAGPLSETRKMVLLK